MTKYIAVAMLLAASVQPAAAKDPIQVGMAVALTGFLANYDGQFIAGAKLAAAVANGAGGVDGHPLDLHILDDASNATTGVTVTNQLLNQFGVSVMLNGLSSAQNAAIEPILARAKVPMIVFSVLPPDPVWAFLANLPDQRAAALQLDYAVKALKAKKIAFIYSQTPYGQRGAQVLTDGAKAAGVDVVFSSAVEPNVTDMTPQLAKIKDAGPDALIDIVTGATHIVEAKAAATVGLKAPIVAAQDDLPTYQKASAAYPAMVFLVPPPQAYPHIPDPALKAAYEAFLAAAKGKLDPAVIAGATFGWDAVQILAQGMKAAGATGGEPLRGALEHVTVQGTNTLYKYSPADHSGQTDVPLSLQIGKIAGDGIEIVYPK